MEAGSQARRQNKIVKVREDRAANDHNPEFAEWEAVDIENESFSFCIGPENTYTTISNDIVI